MLFHVTSPCKIFLVSIYDMLEEKLIGLKAIDRSKMPILKFQLDGVFTKIPYGHVIHNKLILYKINREGIDTINGPRDIDAI